VATARGATDLGALEDHARNLARGAGRAQEKQLTARHRAAELTVVGAKLSISFALNAFISLGIGGRCWLLDMS